MESVKCIVDVAAITLCGPTRSENQDAIVVDGIIAQKDKTRLSLSSKLTGDNVLTVAVCDGMGGYAGGADAALLLANAISGYSLKSDDSDDADKFVNAISNKVLKAGYAWGMPDMGAAFAMLSLDGENFSVVNVGDCRVYKYNSAEKVLGLHTIDDRLANGNGGITQSIGGMSAELDSHFFSDVAESEDWFLLCCDGVWGTLDDPTLEEILGESKNVVEALNGIKEKCFELKSSDNCSVIVVKLSKPNMETA